MDKKRLLSMFNHLVEERDKFHEKILFIDGTNTFIRSVAVNVTLNDNGDHVGGILGFLMSIGHAIKITRPTKVVVIFDGKNGSKYRKSIYPEYKENRSSKRSISKLFSNPEEEEISVLKQLKRLVEYLYCFPLHIVIANDIEADDAISYFVREKYRESGIKKIIMSTDKDFLQLVDEDVVVWSPTKKIFYTKDNFKEMLGLSSDNYLIYKSILGDKSDNVSGLKGCGEKTLQKRFPLLFEDNRVSVNDLFEFATKQNKETNYKIYSDFINEQDKLQKNIQVIQLMDPHISEHTKILLSNSVDRDTPQLNKIKFLKYLTEDRLNLNIKNPEYWIRDVWFNLQMNE